MTRAYDDGSISAARKETYLSRIRARLEAAIDPAPVEAPSLDSLTAVFYDKVSKNRAKEEAIRVERSDHLPSDDGTPVKPSYLKGWVPLFKNSMKWAYEDMFDREGAQSKAANELGSHVDLAIRKRGGSTEIIAAKLADHDRMRDIDRSVIVLRDAIAYIPFAVGANNATAMGTAAKLANSSNASGAINKARNAYETCATLLADSPELLRRFPRLEVKSVGLFPLMAAPFDGGSANAASDAKEMLPLVDQFREELNSFDVMEAFQGVWQDRAAICHALGLATEARVCADVASEYDSSYFEKLDALWRNPEKTARAEPSAPERP